MDNVTLARRAYAGVSTDDYQPYLDLDFRDGKIIRMRCIANLANYIEAHLGVGWSTRRD